MTKELLNEAERFLLSRWAEARLLEESMEAVRAKYRELFQRVVEAVTGTHPELDRHVFYATQIWSSGSIAMGRTSWPASDNYEPPGLWMWNLRLEKLAAEDEPAPTASIWLPPKTIKKANIDRVAARAVFAKAATDLLEAHEAARLTKLDSSDQALIRFTMRPKSELLSMLSEGDGQKFVDYLTSEFDTLARFIPTLDDVLAKSAPQP